jgi:hypothetical protein
MTQEDELIMWLKLSQQLHTIPSEYMSLNFHNFDDEINYRIQELKEELYPEERED